MRYQEKFHEVNWHHLEENVSGDCRSLCTFLSNSRTRLSGERLRYSWPWFGAKRFTRWPLPATFYMCIGLILNQNITNGNLAPKRAKVLSNTFGSAFPLPLFQPDIPFTPFKLQSFLCTLVSCPICIEIFKALLCFRLILSFSFSVTLLASFFTLHYLVW